MIDKSLFSASGLAGQTRFTEYMVRENRLSERGFEGWVFAPGMLFDATDKWWGDKGKRSIPHEGLDFCLYKDGRGSVLRLEEDSRVPVMYDGCVMGIIDDFLGKSVIVEHRFPTLPRQGFLTIYGHTVPDRGCVVGGPVKAGDVIATIAGLGASRRDMYPHLHVCLGWPSGSIALEGLNWQNMREGLIMLDPLAVIDGHHSVQPFP